MQEFVLQVNQQKLDEFNQVLGLPQQWSRLAHKASRSSTRFRCIIQRDQTFSLVNPLTPMDARQAPAGDDNQYFLITETVFAALCQQNAASNEAAVIRKVLLPLERESFLALVQSMSGVQSVLQELAMVSPRYHFVLESIFPLALGPFCGVAYYLATSHRLRRVTLRELSPAEQRLLKEEAAAMIFITMTATIGYYGGLISARFLLTLLSFHPVGVPFAMVLILASANGSSVLSMAAQLTCEYAKHGEIRSRPEQILMDYLEKLGTSLAFQLLAYIPLVSTIGLTLPSQLSHSVNLAMVYASIGFAVFAFYRGQVFCTEKLSGERAETETAVLTHSP